MTPEQKLAALKAEAAQLRKKSAEQFTDADTKRATELVAEINATEEIIARKTAASDAMRGLSDPVQFNEEDPSDDGGTLLGLKSHAMKGQPAGALTLARSSRTATFVEQALKAFKAAAPTVGGPFAAKALVPQGALSAGYGGVLVQDPQGAPSLLNVLAGSAVFAAKGTYLAQTTAEHNAAPVAMGAVKPISVYGLEEREWKLSTVASLSEPIPQQRLDDYEELVAFLGSQLAYGIRSAVTDLLLNGGTAEDGTEVDGILTASGVAQTDYLLSPVRSIRRAIREQQAAGALVSHIVLSPAAWENIEADQIADGQYMLHGRGVPIDAVVPQLFGVPVVVESRLDDDAALVIDAATIGYLYRESLTIAWAANPFAGRLPGVGDASTIEPYFAKNLVEFRAEVRSGFALASLPSLRVVDLVAPEEPEEEE